MKLLTLRSKGGLRPGVMVGSDVLDLAAAGELVPEAMRVPATMRAILAMGSDCCQLIAEVVERSREPELHHRLSERDALAPFDQVRLGPVVPDPAMFLSIGANSHGHVKEMDDAPCSNPEGFFKVRSAISASGDDIRPPSDYADMLDWEGELCVVIGKRCHRVSAAEAGAHIAGYTLTNDVSARHPVRDYVAARERRGVMDAYHRLIHLKNFPGFCPIGPVIATPDEFPADWDYHMETHVNGEVMQRSNKADLVFGPAEILAHFSHFFVFEPGDIFSLGSPPGVGMAMSPPRFLKPGDVVEISVAEIGVLSNKIGEPY